MAEPPTSWLLVDGGTEAPVIRAGAGLPVSRWTRPPLTLQTVIKPSRCESWVSGLSLQGCGPPMPQAPLQSDSFPATTWSPQASEP